MDQGVSAFCSLRVLSESDLPTPGSGSLKLTLPTHPAHKITFSADKARETPRGKKQLVAMA